MIFRRRTIPTVTNDAYRRWLRAQRPAWAWFFGLTELEQEQLALLGDEHTQDLIVSLGYAIQDPALADASIGAQQGEARGEEALAKRLVDGLAARILARQDAPQAPKPRSMPSATLAGFGSRTQAAAAPKAGRRTPQLFGRPADTQEVAT
jgi:hypothetical protein